MIRRDLRPRGEGATWRAPYFDLRSGLFIPCVVTWDAEAGEFSRVEGPRGFATWEEAEEGGVLRSATRTNEGQ